MKHFYKYVKTIGINICIFILLILILNLISIVTYKVYKGTVSVRSTERRARHLSASPIFEEFDWAYSFFKDNEKTDFEYNSFVTFREKSMSTATINITDGVRHSINHSDIADVVFLGGSTMFGLGANDANTIPSLVAKRMRSEFTVKNLGNSGHNAFQGLIKLERELIGANRPRIVISYDGVNEIANLMKDVQNYPNDIFSEKMRILFENNNDNNDLINFSEYFSSQIKPLAQITLLAKNKIEKRTPTSYFKNDKDDIQLAARILVESWKKMKVLCDSDSIDFICILQPTAAVGSPNLDYVTRDVLRDVYEPLYQEVRRIVNNTPAYNVLKGNFYDFSHKLDGEIPYYYDYCHINPRGNEIVAKSIASIIDKIP